MKTINRIQELIQSSVPKTESSAGYGVDICFGSKSDPLYCKWFSVKFPEYAAASNWAEKVVERFKDHTDFPLNTVLVVKLNRNENESPEVIDNYLFPNKTYYAVLEICKIYRNDPFESFIWRKPCQSRQETAEFLSRVGNGKSGLYWVYKADIQ